MASNRWWMWGEGSKEARRAEVERLDSVITSGNFTAQTIGSLRDILDHERLCKASPEPALRLTALPLHWLEQFLLRFSEDITPSVTAETLLQRELQARTLSSTLGCLSADGLQGFTNGFFQKLNGHLRDRFDDVYHQAVRGAPFSAAHFRQRETAYLLASTAAYARRFSQSMPIGIDAVKRVVATISLAFAIASCINASHVAMLQGSFVNRKQGFGPANLPELLENLKRILKPLPWSSGQQYPTMSSYQELARMIVSAHRIACELERDPPYPEADTSGSVNYAEELAIVFLEKILSILSKEPYEDFETKISAPSPFAEDFRAAFHPGPPKMNAYFFVYALLDCAAQVSRVLPFAKVPNHAKKKMLQVMRQSCEPSYRWKATEILLSNADDRSSSVAWLDERISPWPANLLREVDVIYGCLDEEIGLTPQPISSVLKCPTGPSGSISPAQGVQSPVSSNLLPWQEAAFSTSPVPGPESSEDLNLSELPSRRSVWSLGQRKPYTSAGLSIEGNVAYLLDTRSLVVLALDPSAASDRGTLMLNYVPHDGRRLQHAAVSRSFVAVITLWSLSVYRTITKHLVGQIVFAAGASDGQWTADCLAIHEATDYTFIAVGGRGRAGASIRLYSINAMGSLQYEEEPENASAALQELSSFIKVVAFARDGSRLIAVTHSNQVFVETFGSIGKGDPARYQLPLRRYSTVSHLFSRSMVYPRPPPDNNYRRKWLPLASPPQRSSERPATSTMPC